MDIFPNPFRPGAGQLPPHLAGRQDQLTYFDTNTLSQNPILTNLIITGLRGVGKTVLLDSIRPVAINKGWIWAGSDLSESASVSERNLSTRILADLAVASSHLIVREEEEKQIGFNVQPAKNPVYLNYNLISQIYSDTPGLEADKLKATIGFIWANVKDKAKGIILAYDEAQNLTDQAEDRQYPLSVLLEVVQYVQRKQISIILILTGLPTLFPNLVATRTYAERMFHQMTLKKLSPEESKEAIVIPIKKDNCPVSLSEKFIGEIIETSGGYPYFIQYICKEIYDSFLQQLSVNNHSPRISLDDIVRKLDTDFYQGRWDRVTDRQKDLLIIISNLGNAEDEFTLKEIEEESNKTATPFKRSPINLMLKSLSESGLIYKNRHGKYSFAVPMFSYFIKREMETEL